MEGDHIYEVAQALFLEKDEQVPKTLADYVKVKLNPSLRTGDRP